MATIAITNQKGGCGKTMTATNLACGLAGAGFRTLLVDLDPQAPVAPGLGVQPTQDLLPMAEAIRRGQLAPIVVPTRTPGLCVAPGDVSLDHQALANEPLRDTLLQRALRPLVGEFAFILLDTPPSLDLVTLNAMMAADWLILPCDVDREALLSLNRTLEVMYEYVQHRPEVDPESFYRVLVTNHDPRDQVMNAWLDDQLTRFAQPLFFTRIRRSAALKKARAGGLSIFEYSQRQRGGGARRAVDDFQALTQEVLAHETKRSDQHGYPDAVAAHPTH